MKATAIGAVVLLLTLTPRPARAAEVAAELTFESTGLVARLNIPFSFGSQSLGKISTVTFTLCFKQPASPPGVCDAGGTVTQQQGLASPFFLAGRFRENIATGMKTQVNFPVTLASGQRLVLYNQWVSSQVGPAQDSLVLRGTAASGGADDLTLDLTGSGVTPGPCQPSTQALCLNDERFKVQSHYLTSTAQSGSASGGEITGDTGYLFFFSPSNVEALVKVLNACTLNNRYWVFAGGLTNVRTVITVTDTERNAVKTYINPQGTPFQPIQDTSAFATCP